MTMQIASSLGLIGLGLIGGSFAKALRERKAVGAVYGFDLRMQEAHTAKRLGVIDDYCESIAELVTNSQVIVLATPVKAIESILLAMKPYLTDSHVITDMGSVKGLVVENIRNVFLGTLPGFVPGHPIAGSEKSGVSASQVDLFENHKTILTPLSCTSLEALETVAKLWKAVGAQVLMMSAERHDEVLAATSHLPHLIAFSLVDTLAGADDNKEIFRYAAGGFRDFTRIAASDPTMWHDIYLSNRDAVLKVIDDFTKDLGHLRSAIEARDGDTLMGVFTRAKAARDHFSRMLEGRSYQETSEQASSDNIQVGESSCVKGHVRVMGDRSISHRAIILAALAEGTSTLEGVMESEASMATVQAFRDMGVVIEGPDRGRVVVHGVGLNGLRKPPGPLYVGHSTLTMRLLAGVLAGQDFDSELVGDESTRSQSMTVLKEALNALGADVEVRDNGCPPLLVKGGRLLSGRKVCLAESSGQIKSSLLLAGLYAKGQVVVEEPSPSRDHVERLMDGLGYPISALNNQISISGGGHLKAFDIEVPGDITFAFYFVLAATIIKDSNLVVHRLGVNPSRRLALNLLVKAGADIVIVQEFGVAGELAADLRVRAASISGFELSRQDILDCKDELPGLMIAALFASGKTVLNTGGELPSLVQERLDKMLAVFKALEVDHIEDKGAVILLPLSEHKIGHLKSQITAQNDPYITLALAVLLCRLPQSGQIADCASLELFYPEYSVLAREIGLPINIPHM